MVTPQIVPGSERSRPLLRAKERALRRFKRAGIPMPKRITCFWTNWAGGKASSKPIYWFTIPITIREAVEYLEPLAEEYLDYYVTHELCHIADHFNRTQRKSHGKPFHRIFAMVAPKKYWGFEYSYQDQFLDRLQEWGLDIPDDAPDRPTWW